MDPGCSPAGPSPGSPKKWVGMAILGGQVRGSEDAGVVLVEAWLADQEPRAGESESLSAQAQCPAPCHALLRLIPSIPQHHWVWSAWLLWE